MQERIKALSVLALSGGLDPMDCQETRKISRVQQKILGEERGKHTGGNTQGCSNVKTWVGGLTAERFSWFSGEKWHCTRKGEGRKMGILSNQDYVTI